MEMRMPQYGMGMTDGTVIVWHKREGDTLIEGEPLLDIEAAKTTVEVMSPASGVLAKILVPTDTSVPVNTPIAWIETSAGASAQRSSPLLAVSGEGASAPAAPTKVTPLARRAAERLGLDLAEVKGSGSRGRMKALDVARAAEGLCSLQIEPRARRAAKELGVDLLRVTGSGPGGRIIEEDVRAHAAMALEPQLPETPREPVAEGRSVPHSAMRRTVAARLSESKSTVPHFYMRATCEVGGLLVLRRQLNDAFSHARVSVNDLIVRAVALSLQRVPAANVAWTDAAMLQFDRVDVSVAVATPRGLITPIVRDADRKPITALAAEMRDLVERARAGKLAPHEYQGGCSSVSNLGMYGVEEFTAIINPPQATVFAIGAAEDRAVVRDGSLVAATVMTVNLSIDHRAIDGAIAAELLASFKSLIEQPALILV